MTLLIAGLILFLGVHTLTTLRKTRASLIAQLGEGRYKGLYSLVSAIGLVMIVWGFSRYRAAGFVQVWDPPQWLYPVALVLVWLGFVAVAAAYTPPGKIKATLKHPMLTGVKSWALAHLLVNGDLGSLLLFGGFLAWAVYDRIALKRRGDMGAPASSVTAGGVTAGDAIAVVFGSLAYAAMYFLHAILIGVPVG